ncbi:hypothetical protein PMAYCL1PPCAC_04504, partial [Pristionchus mayeri]
CLRGGRRMCAPSGMEGSFFPYHEDVENYELMWACVESSLPLSISIAQCSLVFHPEYDIFFGHEKYHPFDASKWGNVTDYLKEWGLVSPSAISPSGGGDPARSPHRPHTKIFELPLQSFSSEKRILDYVPLHHAVLHHE